MLITELSENTSIKNFEKEINDLLKPNFDFLEKELAKLRTNRAHPSLIEDIKIFCYNSSNQLKNLGIITILESNTLLIQPFDIDTLPDIEKALSQSEFGFNPKNDGNSIKIVLPQISKERRIELVKLVSKKNEEIMNSGRKIRQDILNEIKKKEKDKKISQDFSQRLQKILQNSFDQFSQTINQISKKKEISLQEI